jgi:TRAP-type C4-dicarboxylate transport system substrate-binding protein
VTLRPAAVAALLLWGGAAGAEPVVIRMASLAPEGTPIARELHAFGSQVALETKGKVNVRWVLGAVAGDEPQAAERIARGQLDGMASAGPLCEQLSPTYRALRLFGLFRDRDEVEHVAGQLRPALVGDFEAHGFVHLGESVLGPVMVFSRTPLTSFAELRRATLWSGVQEDTQERQLNAMGVKTLRAPISDAEKALAGIDGFLSVPAGILAYQWWKPAHFASELPVDWLVGCLVLSRRSFDRLPHDVQQTLRAAAARLHQRMAELWRKQDTSLLGGLLQKQGVVLVPASAEMRREFVAAAAEARLKLGTGLVAGEVMRRVEGLLMAYRAQRAARP